MSEAEHLDARLRVTTSQSIPDGTPYVMIDLDEAHYELTFGQSVDVVPIDRDLAIRGTCLDTLDECTQVMLHWPAKKVPRKA